MKKEPNRSEIILYKTEDGAIKIDTIFQDENIWLGNGQVFLDRKFKTIGVIC